MTKNPKLFAFWSPKGGTGKTTLSTQVAILGAIEGKTVAFYDLDPQGSATHYFSQLKAGIDKPAHILNRGDYDAGNVPEGTDIVILDCPPSAEFIPPASFTVIAPTSASGLDLHAFLPSLELFKGKNIIRVINKFSLVRNADKELLAALDPCAVVGVTTAFVYVMSNGESIFKTSASNAIKGARQIRYLAACANKGRTETMTSQIYNAIGNGTHHAPS